MHILRVNVRATTPLFVAGADARRPEMRAASLKGLLRFWYRAAAYQFRDLPRREARLFGGSRAKEGQCPFFVEVSRDNSTIWPWERRLADRFAEGKGRRAKNGLAYLAHMALKDRNALAQDSTFELRFCFPRKPDQSNRQALVSALWLLTHLGGIGTRSRRGFGSLELVSWEAQSGEWPELFELPLLREAADARTWRRECEQALSTLRRWHEPAAEDKTDVQALAHPHLGGGFQIAIPPTRRRQREIEAPEWARALDSAGRWLQDYRSRREPDYGDVRRHLAGDARLRQAPSRATFGLPIQFRYGSLPNKSNRQRFVPMRRTPQGPEVLERHASLLFVRILPIAGTLRPLFIRMGGPAAGTAESETSVGLDRKTRVLDLPKENALDAFMQAITSEES